MKLNRWIAGDAVDKMQKQSAKRNLLTIKDVADILQIRPKDVKGMVVNKEFIPPIILANQERWRWPDIYRFLKLKSSLAYHMKPDFEKGKLVIEPPSDEIPEELAEVQSMLQVFGYRNLPCVYFLISFGTIVYVGQTTNLPTRVSDHRRGRKGTSKKLFNQVLYLPTEEQHLLKTESYFIKKLDPLYNRTGNKTES